MVKSLTVWKIHLIRDVPNIIGIVGKGIFPPSRWTEHANKFSSKTFRFRNVHERHSACSIFVKLFHTGDNASTIAVIRARSD